MRRFYVPPGMIASGPIILEGAEARHAADALRIRPGEEAAILDGAGHEYRCRVEKVERKKIDLKIVQTDTSPPPACRVTLVQAIPKGKIFESIIQKDTELGVYRIVPLLTERVAMRLEDDESGLDKADKWQRIAVEAIKQCGQRWLPMVEPPVTLPEMLAHGEKFDLALVGSLQAGARHPREYFSEYARKNSSKPASVVAWIGPEGDFTAEEIAAIEKSGARPITLGPLVLRSETAAVYTLSIINYELTSPTG